MEDLEKASTSLLTSFAGMGFAYIPLLDPCVIFLAVHGQPGHVSSVPTPRAACKHSLNRII